MAYSPSIPEAFRIAKETALVGLGHLGWAAMRAVNRFLPEGRIQPKWAPAPLLKSRERSFPVLGLPRETDSLCPRCVIETRERILAGEEDLKVLTQGTPGEVKARILEREGQVLIEKDCPTHGHFEDLLSTDVEFFNRLERLFPGRDFRIAPDKLHDHGTSSMKYGRGAVLTVDLTNRCNMMCDPCFMDANQVGYVHELRFEDIQRILDAAISVKPRRQLSVQFSGGEPTMSPFFVEAVAYAKKVGYFSVQAATNGIRFAQDPDLCRRAREAGLRFVYLQFDGVDPESTKLRGVGNILDVKRRALENLYANGITASLVVTLVNSLNNHQVGPIFRFALENIEKIHSLAFQPVSFTGRDEDLPDEQRRRWRYTLSHLAHDFKNQTGLSEPMRDWFPLSASSPFSDLNDLLRGPDAEWGSIRCGCHPNCGTATFLMVNMQTKECTPIPQFLDVERMLEDVKRVNDWGRGPFWTRVAVGLSMLRNLRPKALPRGLTFKEILRSFDSYTGNRLGLTGEKERFRFGMMAVMGMWFQDLFTYDFRRTEMCIIPYATQMGEISFCAYNTGVGWRKIVEKMHRTASVRDWFAAKGKHKVYAGGREVELAAEPAAPHPLFGPRAEDKGFAVTRKT
ncbi:MAG: radical SAM protein [Planctomycetales bacterium]|nr:radical SAM protein [Planctomycetales bacterium]